MKNDINNVSDLDQKKHVSLYKLQNLTELFEQVSLVDFGSRGNEEAFFVIILVIVANADISQ
jgi:hypothetical protein